MIAAHSAQSAGEAGANPRELREERSQALETLTYEAARRDKVVVDRATEVVIHNAILRVDRTSGLVTAKCRRCKGWVEVPLKYVG